MATENIKNKYDKKDSLELGSNAENLFEKIANKNGWTVFSASKTDNIKNHIDYRIKKDNYFVSVDVKSLKRINRKDTVIQDDKIWIELKSVNPKNKGWLYGKADFIVFETVKSFKIVKRTKLIELVDSLVDKNSRVFNSRDALYKIYTRQGRMDEITMIETDKLNDILSGEWEK